MAARAKKLCAADSPKQGVEILAELYIATGHPVWIYNQGRCWEENGLYSKAVPRFEEYLRKVQGLVADERQAVEARIEQLQTKPDRTRDDEAAPAAAPVAVDAVTPPEAQPVPPPPPEDVIAPAPNEPWPWEKTAGIVGVAAGGIGLITGLSFQLVANGRINAFNDRGCGTADLNAVAGCSDRNDKIENTQTVMWAGYISGAALLAAGSYFLLTAPGTSSAERASQTSKFACNLTGPSLTAIACNGRF